MTSDPRAELKSVRNMQFVILLTSLFIVIIHILQFMIVRLPCKFDKKNTYMNMASRLLQQENAPFFILLLEIFLFILIICLFDRMNAFISS